MTRPFPHAGCNYENCELCFPELQDKLLFTDKDHYERAVEIASGAYRRDTEYIDPIAVARYAVKLQTQGM